MVLLPTEEKRIRRRLQCKMNMRCHRDRRKRSALVLETSIVQLQREVEFAERQLRFYRSLSTPSDIPMSIVVEYNKLFSHRICGDPQVQFLQSYFSPTFTNNEKPLDVFISMWFKSASVYAVPDNLLSIRSLDHGQIEMRVQLETPVTYEVLLNCFPFVLEVENDDTIYQLLQARSTMHHVLTRYFYFDQDSNGQCIVSHSTAFDDRFAQLAELVATARQDANVHNLC